MKRLLFLIPIPFIVAINSSTVETISIEDAIKQKLIKVSAMSNGQYYDESVILSVQNLSAKTITLSIPPCYSFYPMEEGEQTLITTEEQLITLNSKQLKKQPIKAFCSEASDAVPTENVPFTFGNTQRKDLQKLMEYTSKHKVSPSALQDAIWAVSDGNSIANIFAETTEDKNLRAYVAETTGRTNPWYTSPQNRQLNESRNIVSETVKIEGDLVFSLPETTTFYQEIRNKAGEVQLKGTKMLTLTKGENIKFHFRIEVTGWEKGEYDVFVISTKNKVVTNYSFAV